IAGPRIAEVPVRHHPRRFGQSKYGLSRIYKVLLDLMVIKTVASFTARPMRWFGLLALPPLAIAMAAFGWTVLEGTLSGGAFPMPIAGTGVIFLSCAAMLLCAGALGELIYQLGDVRDREFSRLTQQKLAESAQMRGVP